MKVMFLKSTALSYDGVNTRTYHEGQVYEPHHGQEKRVFEQAVKDGSALLYGVDEQPVEVKVAPPVETKTKTPKKAK